MLTPACVKLMPGCTVESMPLGGPVGGSILAVLIVTGSQVVFFKKLTYFWLLMFGLVAARTCEATRGAEPDIEQVKKINAFFEQQWKDYALKPAPVEDDGKWCRRVYLDLVGRIPTYAELNTSVRSRDPKKRQALVEMLLEDERFTEDFANHWGAIWSNILIGRSGGNDRRSFISREGMGKYLRDSFA